jgi:hypothetical protein
LFSGDIANKRAGTTPMDTARIATIAPTPSTRHKGMNGWKIGVEPVN